MPLIIYVTSFGFLFGGLFIAYLMLKTAYVMEWLIDVVIDIHKWVSATDARR